MILLLGFAFLSGLVTILAPCIWPLLPIVLSTSIAGNTTSHKRPLGITFGIMVSFAIFTLGISYIVSIFHLDTNYLRLFAVIIIGFLGLTMVVPYLATKFEYAVSKLSGMMGVQNQNQDSGFKSGFIAGLSLGIVWSPCAGPILATIATLASTGQVTIQVVLVTIAYVIGVGIPLFAFAYGGQQFITRARGVSQYTPLIQKIFGVVMILTAFAIYTHYDTYLEAKLLNAFPFFSQSLNQFESNSLVTDQLNALKGKQGAQSTGNSSELLNVNTPAPDFVGINKWLNTDKPLTLADLKGKVVLVDFWTYTCINCIRTLPFVTSWYDKYKDQGFVVIGVHTPEFQFEHDTTNVENAIKMYNIKYPVAQDNDYKTWNNFNNEYWPAEYLIDKDGNVRRTHFGEGEYDQTELAIQALLKEAGKSVSAPLTNMPDETPLNDISPETYVGSSRASGDATLDGKWDVQPEYAVSGDGASIKYNFTAGKVFLVLKKGTTTGKVKVLLDGKPITSVVSGKDVVNGEVTVDEDRLYDLVNLQGKVETHSLELDFETPGTEAYAFTFGS